MADYVPQADADFNTFMLNFFTYTTANAAALGVTPAQLTAIDDAINVDNAWSPAYTAHQDAQTNALAAAATKNNARTALIGVIRPVAQQIQANPGVTDAHRTSLRLTVRDSTRTPSPVPTTRPIATADASQRLQHTLSWRDETTPNTKAKPDGVRGAEIYCAIAATPPADPGAFSFLAVDSSAPYLAVHEAADGGKLAHYILRWVNTRNEPGPWSETLSVTIGA